VTLGLTEKSKLPKRWEEEIMYRGSCMVVQACDYVLIIY